MLYPSVLATRRKKNINLAVRNYQYILEMTSKVVTLCSQFPVFGFEVVPKHNG